MDDPQAYKARTRDAVVMVMVTINYIEPANAIHSETRGSHKKVDFRDSRFVICAFVS